jgi:hypothetical protein
MTDNKKHHYVPKFYLKRFSTDGRSINLYNLKSTKKIIKANLSNQCFKNYFYGEDLTVEHALCEAEGEAASVFRMVEQKGTLPDVWSLGYLAIVQYVLIQYSRTAYMAGALNEMSDQMAKHVLQPMAKSNGIDLDDFVIEIKNTAPYVLGLSMQNYPFLLDLGYKLLVNKTDEEFVTSDNPVVFYNQLMSFRRSGGNTGVASKGLQIFFPIDPNLAIILYDTDVYAIGANKMAVIEITALSDVYQLNALQMCSASENVYFGDARMNLEAIHKKALPFLREQKARLDVYPKGDTAQRRRELLSSSRVEIRTNLDLTFVRIRTSAKCWRDSFKKLKLKPMAVVRDEQLCRDQGEFRKLLDEGKYGPGDFMDFMAEKYGLEKGEPVEGGLAQSPQPGH